MNITETKSTVVFGFQGSSSGSSPTEALCLALRLAQKRGDLMLNSFSVYFLFFSLIRLFLFIFFCGYVFKEKCDAIHAVFYFFHFF